MFKKIILASALAISSTFASWDLFPVLENHKGQTRFSSYYSAYSDEGKLGHSLNFSLGSRYTVYPNLELALTVPYHAFTYYDGNKIGTDGTGKIGLLTRYQFISTMNVFADVYFPNKNDCYRDDPWYFKVGLQFSRKINPLFNFGSDLSFEFSTKDDDGDIPLDAFAAFELDFTITENFAPYIKTNGHLTLGEYSERDHGYQFSHGGGDLFLASYIGVKYDFNETFSTDASAGISRYVTVENYPTVISAQLAFLMNF